MLTGYGKERLAYLAALLGETLPSAAWTVPPEHHDAERELRLARSLLRAGVVVIRVAETDLAEGMDLAHRAAVPCLLVISAPPSAPGQTPAEPEVPEAARHVSAPRVVMQASASLATQLRLVLSAWSQLGDAP